MGLARTNQLHILAQAVLESKLFESALGCMILWNLVLLVAAADARAGDESVPWWITVISRLIVCAYVVEVIVKLLVYGKKAFCSLYSVFDFVVITVGFAVLCLDVVYDGLPAISVLRVFRTLLLPRVFKVPIHELNAMANVFLRTCKAVFWGMLLMLMALLVWALFAVQLIHPVCKNLAKKDPSVFGECHHCANPFGNVFRAMLTLVHTVLAGDGWSNVALPIIEHKPITGLFFLAVFFTVFAGIVNLILAVIVLFREDTQSIELMASEKKERQYAEASSTFINKCRQLDTDQDGRILRTEICESFATSKLADVMKTPYFGQNHIDLILELCGGERKDSVKYEEVMSFLSNLHATDVNMITLEFARQQQKVQHQLALVCQSLCALSLSNAKSDLERSQKLEMHDEMGAVPVEYTRAKMPGEKHIGAVVEDNMLGNSKQVPGPLLHSSLDFNHMLPPNNKYGDTVFQQTNEDSRIMGSTSSQQQTENNVVPALELVAAESSGKIRKTSSDQPFDVSIDEPWRSPDVNPVEHILVSNPVNSYTSEESRKISKSSSGRRLASQSSRRISARSYTLWTCWTQDILTESHLDEEDESDGTDNDGDDLDNESRESAEVPKFFCIANPNSKKRITWDVAGMLVLLCDMVMIPFVFSFDPVDTLELQILKWVALIFWTIDWIFSFFVGYYDKKGRLVMHPGKIAMHYLKTWFVLDSLIVMVDWLMVYVSGQRTGATGVVRVGKLLRAMRILRTLRLLRLAKLTQLVNSMQDRMDSEFLTIGFSVLKLMLIIVAINHFIACAWFKIGKTKVVGYPSWVEAYHFQDQPLDYQYFSALHWSLTQFTPASMNVNPQNTNERLFAVCVLLFAMIVFSSFVSSITAAMNQLRNLSAKNGSQLWLLRKYLRENGVKGDLFVRLVRYASVTADRLQKRVQAKDVKFLSFLSTPLHMELNFEMYRHVIETHPLFQRLFRRCKSLVHKICANAVKIMSLSRGDFVFHLGEHATCMFFVNAGGLTYTQKDTLNDGWSKEIIRSPAWCCESVLWVPWVHAGNMKARSECDIILLESSKFREICLLYPANIPFLRQYGRCFLEGLTAANPSDIDAHISASVTRSMMSVRTLAELTDRE